MATSPASADGVLPSGVRPLRSGDPARIGGHRLLGRLGSGGMGVVYLGEDPLGGFVAVKAAHAGDEESRLRLAAEAACIGRVPTAFTARLLADGTARTPPYIVTEYVEGRSLADIVRKDGPLPPEQLLALAAGVARALAAIHEAGVVHRDLKPPNVLMTPTGPRLIDFGIGQEVGAAGGPTEPGMVVGSPGWIPPERLGRRPATPASDVFGWGCLVAYAATGRNAFGEGDPDELAHRVMREPPELEGVGGPLRDLMEESLAKDPAARPSASELLGLLGVGGPAGPRRSGTREMPAVRRRRWPPAPAGALAAAAVAVAAVIVVIVVVAAGGHHGAPAVPPAGVTRATPSGNEAATHRAPVAAHPRTARSTVTPRPRTVTTTPANGKGKGNGKAKGKGKKGKGPG
ncbi:serine/threonine-protein kinase [Actinomadura sp. DC4]|uniref:serine/threonine-protein kinase n=1 Tax=Actinomadura sp. DC4 TaxID=3055069 RepID=UPI0025B02F3B|nr:serine/threonine-protein kinase [Actinomadura sp. DC4]MDN3352590.1 serine/threonine-protein kinase [Actinomadura sp. DC4]